MPETMIDAAFLPPGPFPPEISVIAGYLESLHQPGPFHAWPLDDWRRAAELLRARGGGHLLPIYLPGPGEDPAAAAAKAADQLAPIAGVAGVELVPTLVCLDREQNRSDLDAEWCVRFAAGLTSDGHSTIGYTSISTEGVFAGWRFRWIGRPGPLAVAPGDSITQCGFEVKMGGGTVDTSAVGPLIDPLMLAVPAATASRPPAPAPAPGAPPALVWAPVNLPVLSTTNPGPNAAVPAVEALQTLINLRIGAGTVAVDGRYGPRTAAAVVEVERRLRLAVDAGVCGPQVWGALLVG